MHSLQQKWTYNMPKKVFDKYVKLFLSKFVILMAKDFLTGK